MSETNMPLGEILRGHSTGLDAHFDKAIAEARRKAAYEYVDGMLDAMQEAEEGPWIARAERRFADWNEHVIGPVRQVMGEAEEVEVTTNDVNLTVTASIPLDKASSAVNIRLKFPVVTGGLNAAYADAYHAKRMRPSKAGGERLWRPEEWQKDLAGRVGSVALAGRNKLGIRRPGLSVTEVREKAVERLGAARETAEFKGVHYALHRYWSHESRDALAEGGVMNPAHKMDYYRYDAISPYHNHGIVSDVLEKFEDNALAVLPEGRLDKQIRGFLRSRVRAGAREIEKKYEFTDKVLQLIVESDFYTKLAQTKTTGR